MVERVPLYLMFIRSDDNAHICAGTEPNTFCGQTDIYSATQIDNTESPVQNLEKNGYSICSKCRDIWDNVSDNIDPESTVKCHRCGSDYSALLSRTVEHMDAGKKPVCRPCYKQLYNDDDSGVRTKYEDAERYMPRSPGSRKLEMNVVEEE